MANRPAILLCAGYGTRMGKLTASMPKPLLSVAERPVLDYLVDELLALDGLATLAVVTNARYREAFEAWADGWRARLDADTPAVTVLDDGSTTPDDRLGAIGDLAFALDRLPATPAGALVAAGDNVLRFSLAPLWRRFRATGRTTVLALHEPETAKLRRTGVLELDADERVLALHEKPEEPPSSWACPSLYCLSASALRRVPEYLDAGRPRDEIGRLLAYLVERERVDAVTTRGERLHVGSPAALRHADEVLRRKSSGPV